MSNAKQPLAQEGRRLSRREFLQTGTAVLGALAAAPALTFGAPALRAERPPNILYIICDQMNLDAMSALGCAAARTPNLDRLAGRGTLFMESHSTNPVCSPARSSLMTGRMPVETGVIHNELPIRTGMPNIGEWLRDQAGYETVYCGKWHMPGSIFMKGFSGFRPLPGGGAQGESDDYWITRSCEAYLRNRAARGPKEPFLLVASYHQPHDICYWMIYPETLVPGELPFERIAGELPALPPNHASRPPGPDRAMRAYQGFKSDLQWRYYLYNYYRMVEMLDRDVGRLLDALEESGYAEETVVLFTADHGDGAGRHGNVQKWHPYDESMKVPLICSGPGRVRTGVRDTTHLVSGLDIVSTCCDYAGVPPPPNARGSSLRPLLEGRPVEWREYLVAEWQEGGRIVRTPGYKYVTFEGDPAVQLFDMREDPWEMKNLAGEARCADVVRGHRKLLDEWNRRLDPAPGA